MALRFLVLALASVSLPAPLWAQPKGSIYHVEPLIDVSAAVAMIGVGGLIDLEKYRWHGLSPCAREGRAPNRAELSAFELLGDGEGACESHGIGSYDRFVVDRRSPEARLASDILLIAMAAAPYGFSLTDVLISDVEHPGLRFGEDALVALEAQAATILATNILKLIVKRPRPLAHNGLNPKEERFTGDSRLSFPSGHASFAFANASLIAYAAQARHGNSAVTWVAGSLAYLTAGLVAYLRVDGGKHFLTDVLAGAAVGIAAGLIIPTLHARDEAPAGDGTGRMMLSIGGTF